MPADIIDSVFDYCGDKDNEEGLTLTKVTETSCMNHLTTLFGMQDKDIARDIFETIDANRDGLVSKEESLKRYQTLGMDRRFNVGGDDTEEGWGCFQ